MNITVRKYKMFADFEKVSSFYVENYKVPDWFNTLPAFEYSHTRGDFDYEKTHRFGIWEDDGEIIATARYEMTIGLYIPCIKRGYEFLKSDMLRYAEQELSKIDENGKRSLEIYSTDRENDDDFYVENGYRVAWSNAILAYPYEKRFRECKLPEGFSLISLEDENDGLQIDCCLWEGFDHGNWDAAARKDEADGRYYMQSGPHFRKDLTTVVKAPNGDYACFAGMWVDEQNGYAYLEPLATRPKYRRMGLATAALMHAMKKTVPFGAKYCYCGAIDFYRNLGCEQIGQLNMWKKEW